MDKRHADPSALAERLRAAWARPELGSPDGEPRRAASYQLAVALGHCRLFGIPVPDGVGGELPTNVATAAAAGLAEEARRRKAEVSGLAERLDACSRWDEAVGLACRSLEAALEIWGAFVVIDEAYQREVEQRAEGLTAFGEVLDSCLDTLEAFDRELSARRELLVLAAGTPLLGDWRSRLAEEFRVVLPWWLDGTLERVAEEVERQALASMPPPRPALVLPSSWAWLPEGARIAARRAEAPATASARWWRSPDGKYLACAFGVPGAGEVRVNFLAGDEVSADLDGRPATLAGHAVVIAGSTAVFLLADLRAAAEAGRLPTLAVGGQEWAGPFERDSDTPR